MKMLFFLNTMFGGNAIINDTIKASITPIIMTSVEVLPHRKKLTITEKQKVSISDEATPSNNNCHGCSDVNLLTILWIIFQTAFSVLCQYWLIFHIVSSWSSSFVVSKYCKAAHKSSLLCGSRVISGLSLFAARN